MMRYAHGRDDKDLEHHMPTMKRWSSFEDEILLNGLNQKQALSDIASRLGRRDSDVQVRAEFLVGTVAMQQARQA